MCQQAKLLDSDYIEHKKSTNFYNKQKKPPKNLPWFQYRVKYSTRLVYFSLSFLTSVHDFFQLFMNSAELILFIKIVILLKKNNVIRNIYALKIKIS